MKISVSFLAAVIPALLLAAPTASASPTGYWKLTVSVDYTTSGTATDSYCFPDPSATRPTPVAGAATSRVTVRTTRPTLVDAHEAPNGVPVFGEYTTARGFRAKVKETRDSNLDTSGEPDGCFGGGPQPKSDCGTNSVQSGLYVNPLGGIHSWRGFTVELQENPAGQFSRCGLTDAHGKLPDPYVIDVRASPKRLTGHAAKLVFRGRDTFKGSANDESTRSTATATLSWQVTLVRARP